MLNEAIKAANHTVPKTEESANEAANVASELSFCVYLHLYASLSISGSVFTSRGLPNKH